MSDISSKLDEVALMVLMLHPNDQQSLDLVFDILNDVKNVASSNQQNARIKESIEWLNNSKGTIDNSILIEKINQFVTAGQHFLQSPDLAIFPNEVKETNWGDDLSQHADSELIVEFIEKHTLQFEEFEARLMELAHSGNTFSPDKLEEERRYIKSYLHNIKGDAGSVGFLGIEKVTHKMEELVLASSPINIVDEVLAYKEWVLNVCKSYSAGNVSDELSKDFLE
jgi:hypothetical protein